MQDSYKIQDAETKDLYIGVCSHYFSVSDAKDVYTKSLNGERNDDSILVQVAKKGTNGVNTKVTFGVEEGEQFALALLNLCNSIKR
ncbi:hypothetical protein [Terribacillus sp. AE2B 122]|uniref:hypothetical protein n=1 Tax=Terribacillus sp. AE2B 122 TaxID=1331902 RepID=UPI001581A787|nr:hypothetical protein [Terribacillus sp. AE2B 122]